MSWDYGRLVAEVYELDKPVGSTFPALRYYTRQLAGVTGRILEPGRRNGPRPGSAARGGFRGRGPGRLAGHAGRLPSALPGPRPGSGAARGRHDHLRGTWRLPGDHHPGGIHHAAGRPRRGAAGAGRLPRVTVARRAADPRYRRARADHRAGAHAVLGTRPVPVDAAGHAHRLRPGGQPDDQLPAVREVARRRPGRHRAAAVPAAVLEPDRIRAPPGRRGIHRHQRDRRLPR